MIRRSIQHMLPQHILASNDYAVMHQTNHHFDHCVSVYSSLELAEEVCDAFNRKLHYDSSNYNSPYAVVRIIHDEGDCDRDQMRVMDAGVDEDSMLCAVDLEGNIVDGDDDSCPFEGECNTWQHLFGCVYDYVQQGVEDAESGGFDGELPAYRVILAYMRGLLDANGVDVIG